MTRDHYQLIDSGDEKRLESFGPYTLIRPCSQAVWKPKNPKLWKNADAIFTREEGNRWSFYRKMPSEWKVRLEDLDFLISPTDFGHLGIFPEHHHQWKWMSELISKRKEPNILNLFAYTGAATIKLAQAGAKVCHLDASKKSVSWACENAKINRSDHLPIRWIVDDAIKFLHREIKRGVKYDAIILDPPSFGKGAKGEIFKIEKDINELLELCSKVLSDDPLFVLFTCHTPGFTPSVMEYLLKQTFSTLGKIEVGEMLIEAKETYPLPSGVFGRWYK